MTNECKWETMRELGRYFYVFLGISLTNLVLPEKCASLYYAETIY